MVENEMEKKIELFVVFQEKLGMKINDSDFRREVLEPMLFNGINEENLAAVINEIQQDEEISGLITGLKEKGHSDESINKELKILLKTLIERFSKYAPQETGDLYIG